MAYPHVAPHHLPATQKKEWKSRYDMALKNAKASYPDDEKSQHTVALKEANKMLSVPAPTSAKEMISLPDWQVKARGQRLIDGVLHDTAVTIDGRKYAYPVATEAIVTVPA